MIALAVLAIAVKVLIPQGYMAPAQPGVGFPLVICTDHGLIKLDDKPTPPGKSRTDSPCAFSGNLVSTAPPLAVIAQSEVWSPTPQRVEIRRDLAPGRGLAAPPPPAIGPPRLI
jgi:hypothetical protein